MMSFQVFMVLLCVSDFKRSDDVGSFERKTD